jgi:anti-sigma regulatory factor (Ser/Thr protein kinase)
MQCSVQLDTQSQVGTVRLEAELHSSLELVIDVTPHIYSPSNVVVSCIDFLETNNVGHQTVEAFRLVISEALANAIEHGVLCMPSYLKEDPFHPYHEVLRNRMNEIKPSQVFLKVNLLHENGECDSVKAIGIEVSDSGPGFDWRKHMSNPELPAADMPFGRGLALIKMTAGPLHFNEAGNSLRFVLPCQQDS